MSEYEREAYIDMTKDLLTGILQLPRGCKVDDVFSMDDHVFRIRIKWNPIVCLEMPEVEEGKCPQVQVGYKKIEAITLVELNVVDDE